MNTVGSIGQFFINYQVEIEGAVFVLLILLTLYLFVKYIGRDKKNEAKIAELTAKLESIESQVAAKAAEPASAPAVETAAFEVAAEPAAAPEPAAELAAAPEPATEPTAAPEPATKADAIAESATAEPAVAPELAVEPAVAPEPEFVLEPASVEIAEASAAAALGPKFKSRDCAKDRHGNVYTEEMLRDQIG